MVDSWNRIPSAGKAQVAPLTEVLICVRHLNASPKNCARPIEASATSLALFGRSQYFRLDRKLTGTWVKSGSAIGENEAAEKSEKSEAGEHHGVAERHFKVSDIQHVADSCPQGAAGTKQ